MFPLLPLQEKFAAVVRRVEWLRAQQREADRQRTLLSDSTAPHVRRKRLFATGILGLVGVATAEQITNSVAPAPVPPRVARYLPLLLTGGGLRLSERAANQSRDANQWPKVFDCADLRRL
jgi:hypothetical protein